MGKPWHLRHKSENSSPSWLLFGRSHLRSVGGGRNPSEDVKGPFGLNTLSNPLGDAIADLVFVHGLGGGSRSTWTKSSNSKLYWPQTWLPEDPGFKEVRIHSFGYHSNWAKESILNIHDFAKSLLGSIQDCPAIPRGSNVRSPSNPLSTANNFNPCS